MYGKKVLGNQGLIASSSAVYYQGVGKGGGGGGGGGGILRGSGTPLYNLDF